MKGDWNATRIFFSSEEGEMEAFCHIRSLHRTVLAVVFKLQSKLMS